MLRGIFESSGKPIAFSLVDVRSTRVCFLSGYVQPPLVVAARRGVRAGPLRCGQCQRDGQRLPRAARMVGGKLVLLLKLPARLHSAAARGRREPGGRPFRSRRAHRI
eukprot:4881569-Prymnesium_polylepis.1